MHETLDPLAGPIAPEPSPELWPKLLQQLLDRQSLSVDQATQLMQGWLQATIDPVLSGAILAAIQAKGVSASELVGMAQVLQSQSTAQSSQSPAESSQSPARSPQSPIQTLQSPAQSPQFLVSHQSYAGRTAPLIDTCGTGGDGASTFNISTAVAFVAAAAGVAVAKHGNRSASGKVGSADVLEALGVNLSAPPEQIRAALDQVGITFLFAPGWHPALKAVAPLRKTLKIRTIFNLLGPLVNPLRPTGQVLGVSAPDLVETIAQALAQLGVKRGMVVYGREGLDEAGLGDESELAQVRDGQVERQTLDPQTFGLIHAPLEALRGGEVMDNAAILREVLQGRGTPAQQDVVILNSALALQVGERVASIAEGITLARSLLQTGAPWDKLQALVHFLAS